MPCLTHVSRCGYYAWLSREPSKREQANVRLLEKIKAIHQQTRQTCSSDKTWRLLTLQGEPCGRHRVARLRQANGIEAIRMKRLEQAKVLEIMNRCLVIYWTDSFQ